MLFDWILFTKNLYFDNLVVNRDEPTLNYLLLEIVSIEGRTESGELRSIYPSWKINIKNKRVHFDVYPFALRAMFEFYD